MENAFNDLLIRESRSYSNKLNFVESRYFPDVHMGEIEVNGKVIKYHYCHFNEFMSELSKICEEKGIDIMEPYFYEYICQYGHLVFDIKQGAGEKCRLYLIDSYLGEYSDLVECNNAMMKFIKNLENMGVVL